jgi:hypothetical protein
MAPAASPSPLPNRPKSRSQASNVKLKFTALNYSGQMFVHEHTHSMVLDLSLLFIGLCVGMFLGYIAGVLVSDARSRKAAPPPQWLSRRH